MIESVANDNAQRAIRTSHRHASRMERLERVIMDSRHRFYSPISREILPPFGEFIHTIQSAVHELNTEGKEPPPTIEQGVILLLADEEIESLVYSFSSAHLDQEHEHALSREHYITNTQKRMTKLKGRLLFAEDERLARLYLCASFLYELSRSPLLSILLECAGTKGKGNTTSFKSVSGIKILRDLIAFTQLLHSFADVEWVPEIVDILHASVETEGLNVDRLSTVVKQARSVIDDGILLYIIQHVRRDPFKEIAISRFDRDVVAECLVGLRTNVDFIDKKYAELNRQQIARNISLDLFSHLPSSTLTVYTIKNKEELEKQAVHCFKYADIVEYITLFIDHIYNTLMADNLRDPLLLKAVWREKNKQRSFAKVIRNMKDLRARISAIDQDIVVALGGANLLDKALHSFNFLESAHKKTVLARFTRADSRFSETTRIFQGILRHTVNQFRALLADRETKKMVIIRNWIEIDHNHPNLAYGITKAISVSEACMRLIEVTSR